MPTMTNPGTPPLSKIVHQFDRESRQPARATPQLLVLHDRQDRMSDALEFAVPLRDRAAIVALEAPKGVWYGKQIVGYTWFIGDSERPAPYSFGVGLSELELFLLDTLDRRAPGNDALPYLLGLGQGGVMALSSATVQPDRLSGVIAIDAIFPSVPGWTPPLAPLDGLPVLLIETSGHAHQTDLANRFTDWGGTVERHTIAATDESHAIIAAWLDAHPPRIGAPE